MKNYKLALILMVGILFLRTRGWGVDLGMNVNTLKPHQGEVVKIELWQKKTKKKNKKFEPAELMKFTIAIKAFGKEYRPFRYGNRDAVFIGIDYQLKSGIYPMAVNLKYQEVSFGYKLVFLRVKPRYGVPNPKIPDRDPELQKRIDQEKFLLDAALFSPSVYKEDLDGGFWWPIKKAKGNFITSRFGEHRPKNSKNFRYHAGVDFRSAFDKNHQKPELVFPINDGIVVESGDYFFEGKMLVVDHGNNVKSAYFHLSKFLCEKGNRVTPKKPIAVSGKTGAGIEAIHLHLVIAVNGAIVDPLQFLRAAGVR